MLKFGKLLFYNVCFYIVGVIHLLFLSSFCNGDKIDKMTVEYVENNICVDTEKPRFGWLIDSDYAHRGIYQIAYHIILKDKAGKTVWDTGKVLSGESQNIVYNGDTLLPTSRYEWHVKVWDNKGKELHGKSWFETSLMSSNDIDGWNNAKWIGGDDNDMVLYSHYLPVFKLNLSFQLRNNITSKKVGFIYGANDERLMDRNKNIYHIACNKGESYIKIEFDMSPILTGKEAVINVFRVGYHKNDRTDKPITSFNISRNIINENNLYSHHNFTLYSNLGYTKLLYGTSLIGDCNMNPLGSGGNYIAFPVLGDVGFTFETDESITDAKIDICNFRSPENILNTIKYDSESIYENNRDVYIVNPSRNSSPVLRNVFRTKNKAIEKARLYVTSRGIYEIYINGQRIGDDCFNPGITQYNRTQLYQVYDITENLNKGKNAIGALLSEGWWSGASTYSGENWNFFGDRQSLLAQLVITYKDGSKQTVVTSPKTWKYYSDGPVVYGSFFQGEIYNALKEIKDWNTIHFNDSDWKYAVEVPLSGCISNIGSSNKNTSLSRTNTGDYSEYRLIAQYGQTVKKIKKLTALSVEEVRPGVFVYDMGQNMVGVPEIVLSGYEPGKVINMRYAEVKYPDLPRYSDNKGMIMLENIRAAMAQDKYITKGGYEVYSPRFTFHGYRYIEITGIDKALPIDCVKGVVLSSIDKLTSSYETSNDKVNKLWNNIVWSTYANFLSIPTDCPQRNERMGWAGDISVFSRTATYLADVSQFLRRYLQAMRDVQRKDGKFLDIAPMGGGFGGILWGSAGLTVLWELYQQYGDRFLLEEHYDSMYKYIDYIIKKNIDNKSNVITQEKVYGNLGDWLGPEDKKNDKTLMWEAYFIYDLEIMKQVANILDKHDDMEKISKLYDERLAFFNETYIDKSTAKTIAAGVNGMKKGQLVDLQTSYALPLAFNIVDSELKEKFASNLVNTVKRENIADDGKVYPSYSLMTGFIGTAWISMALSENGYDDVAYNLLQQTTYPSWLYSVEQGATTIWERLNSYTHIDGFGENNRMNSFNHYSFGAVGAWMYSYSLGIMRDKSSPGFKHFILSPRIDPTGQMRYAKGYYDSLYGRIESSWMHSDIENSYSFTIPANTTATLRIPAKSIDSVKENGNPIDKTVGILSSKMENGMVVIELSSGKYEFVVSL